MHGKQRLMRGGVAAIWGPVAVAALACGVAASSANAQAGKAAPDAAKGKQVLATVDGEPITRAQFLAYVSKTPIPPDKVDQVYDAAIEQIVNLRILIRFLDRQKIVATQDKVDADVENLKRELTQQGRDLPSVLAESGMTLDEIREQFATRIRWMEYAKDRATDAELKRYVQENKDFFNHTQIKVSHIQVSVDPSATAAQREAAQKKLAEIKTGIERNKYTFAQAADKYSQDTSKTEGDGGDIGYISLDSGIDEDFAKAAFSQKKGSISDPIESPFGYHLIQVTDRQEGRPLDFERNKPLVMQRYMVELQRRVIEAEKKKAKIVINPMPKDLFPPPEPDKAAQPAGAAPKAAAPK